MRRLTTEERFKLFHAEHPEVLQELVRLARIAQAAGRKKCGVRMLWETMRWSFYIKRTAAGGEYTFNDHFTSRYVRLIEAEYPEFQGFFERRALRSV